MKQISESKRRELLKEIGKHPKEIIKQGDALIERFNEMTCDCDCIGKDCDNCHINHVGFCPNSKIRNNVKCAIECCKVVIEEFWPTKFEYTPDMVFKRMEEYKQILSYLESKL